MLNELCRVTAGKISLHGGSFGCSFSEKSKFLRTVTLSSSSVIRKEHQDWCSDKTVNLWPVVDVTVRGQNHGCDMGLRQMLRWFWKQLMSWKVRRIEGWQDCAGSQFRKGLKPGGSCIHRSLWVWVDLVILLGPRLTVPGQNFLALWKRAHACKESNGLGMQTQNCHWKHSPSHGLALLLVNSQGRLTLTWDRV